MTKINEIKAGTYVTAKTGSSYKAMSSDLRLVKSDDYSLDDEVSVGFNIEQGTITECDNSSFGAGRTYSKGNIVYLSLVDIKVIHA